MQVQHVCLSKSRSKSGSQLLTSLMAANCALATSSRLKKVDRNLIHSARFRGPGSDWALQGRGREQRQIDWQRQAGREGAGQHTRGRERGRRGKKDQHNTARTAQEHRPQSMAQHAQHRAQVILLGTQHRSPRHSTVVIGTR